MKVNTKDHLKPDEILHIIQSLTALVEPEATILDKAVADDLESGWAAVDTTQGVIHKWFTLDDGREVAGVITYKY